MIYFVRNANGENIAEIEIYWAEEFFDNDMAKTFWSLDCRSEFYLRNFLPEFKERSDCMTEKSLKSFIDDIDEIQQFRGYIRYEEDKLNACKIIDHFNIHAPESQNAQSVVAYEAKMLLEKFCDKYGFYLFED